MEILQIGIQDFRSVKSFYTSITKDLVNKGIKQWDFLYPNRFIIKGDLKSGTLFGIKEGNNVVGAIVLDTHQSNKHKSIHWEDQNGRPLLIHRLGVHPESQGKGYGKILLKFAEEYAQKNGHTSIRFDVYSQNPRALGMYENAGYRSKGEIRYPFRGVPYQCFEKVFE